MWQCDSLAFPAEQRMYIHINTSSIVWPFIKAPDMSTARSRQQQTQCTSLGLPFTHSVSTTLQPESTMPSAVAAPKADRKKQNTQNYLKGSPKSKDNLNGSVNVKYCEHIRAQCRNSTDHDRDMHPLSTLRPTSKKILWTFYMSSTTYTWQNAQPPSPSFIQWTTLKRTEWLWERFPPPYF